MRGRTALTPFSKSKAIIEDSDDEVDEDAGEDGDEAPAGNGTGDVSGAEENTPAGVQSEDDDDE